MGSFSYNPDCHVMIFVSNQERVLSEDWHNQSYTYIRWTWQQWVGCKWGKEQDWWVTEAEGMEFINEKILNDKKVKLVLKSLTIRWVFGPRMFTKFAFSRVTNYRQRVWELKQK